MYGLVGTNRYGVRIHDVVFPTVESIGVAMSRMVIVNISPI